MAMTRQKQDKPKFAAKNLPAILAKSFVAGSVLAVLIPLPFYPASLGREEYVIWLARLIWVLLLIFGVGSILLAACMLQNRRKK
jgi:hypothetical protein